MSDTWPDAPWCGFDKPSYTTSNALVDEWEAICRRVGARGIGGWRWRTLAIAGFLGANLAGLAQPVADQPDFAPCLREPTTVCLTDEFRRLVAPVLANGDSIGWENFQRLITLGELDLAREAALAIRTPAQSGGLPVRELDRRNNLQITRALALVAVMNAHLKAGDFAAAQEVLALTGGMGRIRGVIEYHAALITSGYSGLDAYPAARANLDRVLRETFRDGSARRWFDGAGYSQIGAQLSIPCATAMARIGDIDHALAVAIAQNRAQARGLPSAILGMTRRLLELEDTTTVRGIADHMRNNPDRYHDLDHWTTVLAELAAFETRRGNIAEARKLYAQVAEGFADHRSSPDRDLLLLALVTVEFVRAAPDAARRLVYEAEVLNSATRQEAENHFATALQINGDDARLLEAWRDIGPKQISARENSTIREAIAMALIRQNRTAEATELLRAGSSANARRQAVELLLRQGKPADARALLQPEDLPGLAVRLLELERNDDALTVLDDCWSIPEENRPLDAELISATFQARGRSAAEALIGAINNPALRDQTWILLGNELIDRGETAEAQAAYEKANLSEEQSARVQQYLAAVRSGRPAATARYFATDAVRDDAGQFLPSNTRVYPSRIPGIEPLAFLRAIARIDYWESLSGDNQRELLLRAAVALKQRSSE